MSKELDFIGTNTSPDALMEDNDSMEFYMLRDESIVLSKNKHELPYHKNRSTYLASGRFSPKYKKVIFWQDAINSQRAFDLLCEKNYIDNQYTYHLSGITTTTSKVNTNKKFENLRQAQIDNYLNKGMKIQKSSDD